MAEAAAPISRGSLLAGRYRLRELVDQGDDGAGLWRASDLTLNRDVAVNVIAADDPRAEDLIEAARSAASLSGQHQVRVLDAADEDGLAYVVSEWADATPLAKLVSERPMPPRRAAWMVRELSDALVDAHHSGVAHGRLVPETVLVGDNGQVSLVGFCVEHVLRRQNEATPEQDVRDLVAILYAALTSAWPGSTTTSLSAAPRDHGHLMRARQVRAGVPRELDVLCDSVLNRPGAAGTPRTAAEVRAVLSDYLGDAVALPAVAREALIEQNTVALDLSALQDDFDDTQAPVTPVVPLPPAAQRTVPRPAQRPAQRPAGAAYPATTYPAPNRPTSTAAAWTDPEIDDDAPPPCRGWPIWLRLVVGVASAFVLVAAVALAFSLGRNSDTDTPGTSKTSPSRSATTSQVLDLASVRDFDPYQVGGTPEENPSQVPLATDGDPDTAWETQTYKDGPDITVYKPGVGLLIDLGTVQAVGSVDLTLVGSPYALQILTSTADKAPNDTQGLTVAAQASGVGPEAKLDLVAGTKARYVVVWLTRSPACLRRLPRRDRRCCSDSIVFPY
ncbi:MAG: protein kinase family protein [Propionicimonas sp.]|uniref:protein kinase family protein n=1 Tax=Propionicimonas sp. TaxID=1955623 RepID=UPI003D11A7C9